MLILVGVTVTVSLNGGLFEKAKEGAKGTTIARVKEQITEEIVAKIADNLGENITQGDLEEIAAKYGTVENGKLTLTDGGYKIALSEIWEVDSNENTLASIYCSEENCTEKGHLHKGDYVDYKPTPTAEQYDPDKGAGAGTYTGYQNTQSIKYETLNWRVMGKDENGNILLISGAPTTETLCFYGYVGYNNYDTVLRETCEALYNNTNLKATARNIKPEDIITYLGGFKSEEVYYNAKDINSVVEYKDDKLTVKNTTIKAGELKSTSYAYEINEKVTDKLNLELLGGKDLETNPYYYWISSKGVVIGENGDYAAWAPAVNLAGTIVIHGGIFFYDCEGSAYDFNNEWCLRPVITLPSNTAIEDVKKSENLEETWKDPLGLM